MKNTGFNNHQLQVSTDLKANPLIRFSYLNQPKTDNLTVTLPFEVLAQSSNYQELWQDHAEGVHISKKTTV
jgi:hypothetical protein